MIHGINPSIVEAVVFDLGGVFLSGTVEKVLEFGRSVGMKKEAWVEVSKNLFNNEDGAWGELERGEITLDAFAMELQEQLAAKGIAIDLEKARNFMGSPDDSFEVRLRQEIVDACLSIRKRMPTALLTNNIIEWRQGWERRLDTGALFDHVVDSSEVGMRKPEPGIYKLVEEKLNLPGEKLLFIDDLGSNLKGARQLGWQTLKYDDTQKVLEVLAAVASL